MVHSNPWNIWIASERNVPVIHTKRNVGCTQLNGSTIYQTDGGTFDIFCDFTWHGYYWLSADYTVTFVSCMDSCIEWNNVHLDKCVGVSWAYGVYGPKGEQGGSECSLVWNMPVGEGFQFK